MPRILLIDNYDSFTYNLEHYLVSEGVLVDVVLNDQLNLSEVGLYDAVVLSPGPGLPSEAGMLMLVIEKIKGQVPILGVCLGMQAIAIALGGEIYNQQNVKHGVSEFIRHVDSVLFDGIPETMEVGLYHSWAVKEGTGDFEITAHSESGVVMAIENQALRLFGVQFHPESVMTVQGKELIKNFVGLI